MNEKINNQKTTSTAEYKRLRHEYLSAMVINAAKHGARKMNPEVMKAYLEKEAEILEKYKDVRQPKNN